MSVWWNRFEGASLQTKAFKQWGKQIGLTTVAWKESAEEVVGVVAMMFARMKHLGALDYSKAYYHMCPEIIGKALEAWGIDPELVEVLMAVWSDQERYISFNGNKRESVQGKQSTLTGRAMGTGSDAGVHDRRFPVEIGSQ